MLQESVAETIKNILNLPQNAAGTAKSLVSATGTVSALQSIPAELKQAAAETGAKVEKYAYATLVLQGIAACAAAGMLYVQWQLLKKSRRGVRSNPRGKRG